MSKFTYTVFMDESSNFTVEADGLEYDNTDNSYNFARVGDGDVVALFPANRVLAILRGDAK